uniref:Uncharacterized protein n=1 Tax=Oryza meridionalis TaxID=40149 RepID=A0A0E0ESD0_9ORYZ
MVKFKRVHAQHAWDLLEIVVREVDMPATEELEEATATWELDEAGEKGARHTVPNLALTSPNLPRRARWPATPSQSH